MSWILAALLLAPLSTECVQPTVGAAQARALFRATVERVSANPERYLDQIAEPRFRCIDGQGQWVVSGVGPSGSFDDSEVVWVDAATGATEHRTAPCVVMLKLNHDGASEIAKRYAVTMNVNWGDYHQPFVRSHCKDGSTPYWLFSAMNRSLAADSMMLISIDDDSGVASLVAQG